jgi:hypothetical protein
LFLQSGFRINFGNNLFVRAFTTCPELSSTRSDSVCIRLSALATAMLLQFIVEPTIGRKDRRLIRSHVMKGKNAGKPRPPRKALIKRATEPTTATVSGASCLRPSELLLLSYEHPLLLDRLLWNDLMIASFPECVSPETTKFVYHRMHATTSYHSNFILTRFTGLSIVARICYPLEFCLEVNLSKYVWFTYVLEDKACMPPTFFILLLFRKQQSNTQSLLT